MGDPRVDKLAQVIVHYSLAIKPDDKLRIRGDIAGAPLIKAIYREAIRAGAHVITRFTMDGLQEIFYREANEAQLKYNPDTLIQEIEFITADLYVEAEENTKSLGGVDSKKIAMNRAARAPISKRFAERTAAGEVRWCLTRFPTQAHAQDAGMSLSDYEDFVYNAGLLNDPDPAASWIKVGQQQQRVADFLQQHDEIRIIAPGTDLTYRVGGRKWINADGRYNFPDGEVFTGPHEDPVNGVVSFTYPAIYDGNEVEDVVLTFRNGKVVEATASKGIDFLNAMLDLDNGSRTLGEAAFGLNYGIQNFARDILFDEKIGGTMHLALGACYPETGATNESGLHWDMICDLREGKVYADGQLCYENGKFTI